MNERSGSSAPMAAGGGTVPRKGPIELTAGQLAARFELETLMVRYLSVGGREVLRGIYPTVRDRDWGTVLPEVTDLDVEQNDTSFHLRFEAECRDSSLGIDFTWVGSIRGAVVHGERASLTYALEGTAAATFERNRIGFCIHHPPSVAGMACRVEHTDGSHETGAFPKLIAPHQPFADIAAISHEPVHGVKARVAFTGDVFEMEDQRNWTDASFKTYCTPLRRPFPVTVRAGETVSQSVTLDIDGSPTEGATGPKSNVREARRGEVLVRIGDRARRLPSIGLARASHGGEMTVAERSTLRKLSLRHLRAVVDLAREVRRQVGDATREARSLGLPLELVVHVRDAHVHELEAVAGALQAGDLARIIAFDANPVTSEGTILAVRRAFDRFDVPIVAGTDAFFTELNRNRPGAGLLEQMDGVTYSINPQVHAFDDTSLTETTTAQGITVETAHSFAPGAPVHVGPVTLKMRFNPNATSEDGSDQVSESSPDPGLPEQVDIRQMQPYAAVWTIGSIRDLAGAGAESVTYFETTGWLGVMERERGSADRTLFPSAPGMVFPVYHVFADVCGWLEGVGEKVDVLEICHSDPLKAQALVLAHGTRRRLLLANMTRERIRVRVEGLGGRELHARVLDASTLAAATRAPDTFRAEQPLRISLDEPVELAPRSYLCGDVEVAS